MTARTEYPRPQFYRETWFHLNGEWNFCYDDDDKGVTELWYENPDFPKKILVPFTYQTKKSGIHETDFHDLVWYHRKVTIPSKWENKRRLLHFGAVDYRTWVWVNGKYAGYHEGGHVPFHFDITDYTESGENDIVVRVEDPTQDLTLPRGKQYWKEESEGIFYTRTTGIWQSVWMEAVEPTHLESVTFTPDLDRDTIEIAFETSKTAKQHSLEINITFEGEKVVTDTVKLHQPQGIRKISLGDFHVHDQGRLWSPEHPNLYEAEFIITDGTRTIDKVISYFGMRKVSIENGKVLLNNKPYYMKLVLDQGYFPETLLTPPSDDAILNDIELTKEMGFNGVRKHQKIEDPRYLYWADRKGLLVWGEMANCYMYSADSVSRMTAEWQKAIARDYNHPCIVAWVPINESWGVPKLLSDKKQQAHTQAMYHLTKSLDETRIVMSNDGWEHTHSDLCTIHDYEPDKNVLLDRYSSLTNILNSLPANRPLYAPGFSYRDEPILVTEFGGIAYQKSDWEGWGYSGAVNDKDFAEKYEAVVSAILESPLIHGFCYTQLTDVEQEINGLLTYDRKPKLPPEVIKAINNGNSSRRFSTKEEPV